jgi:hypothetical protein
MPQESLPISNGINTAVCLPMSAPSWSSHAESSGLWREGMSSLTSLLAASLKAQICAWAEAQTPPSPPCPPFYSPRMQRLAKATQQVSGRTRTWTRAE